jgi:hypothetical protein
MWMVLFMQWCCPLVIIDTNTGMWRAMRIVFWSCCTLFAWGPSDIITSTIIILTGTIFHNTIYVVVDSSCMWKSLKCVTVLHVVLWTLWSAGITVVWGHETEFLCSGRAMCWSVQVSIAAAGEEVERFMVVGSLWGCGRFGIMIWGSFRWLFPANSVWIWNLSIVFKWAPFLWQCIIYMKLFMGPNEWDSSIRCFEKVDVLLLLWKAVLSSCIMWRTVCRSVGHRSCCNQDKLIYRTLIERIYSGPGVCG